LAKNEFQKGISKSTFVDFKIRKCIEFLYLLEKQFVAKTRKIRKTAFFAGFNRGVLSEAWFWGRISPCSLKTDHKTSICRL